LFLLSKYLNTINFPNRNFFKEDNLWIKERSVFAWSWLETFFFYFYWAFQLCQMFLLFSFLQFKNVWFVHVDQRLRWVRWVRGHQSQTTPYKCQCKLTCEVLSHVVHSIILNFSNRNINTSQAQLKRWLMTKNRCTDKLRYSTLVKNLYLPSYFCINFL